MRITASGTSYIDYKDTESLRKMVSGNGRILSRKRTGATAMEQRKICQAVKRARYISLLPYVTTTS
jgi:small subunit ribosomal protein S18